MKISPLHPFTRSPLPLVTLAQTCYTDAMPSELLADVAVRASIPGGDPVFTYRVPARLHALVRPGQLVWAPLRRQRVQGIVLELYRQQESGDWVIEGEELGAGRSSPIARLRPDPDA